LREAHVGIVCSVQPLLCLTPQAQPTCTSILFCHAMSKQDRSRGTDPYTARCNSLTMIRSGTVRSWCPQDAESHRVRYIAKAPANPFLFVYDRNTMVPRLKRVSFSKTPAHTSGGYILRDSCQTKARPPAEGQQDRPLIVSPWVKCKSKPLHGLRDLTHSLLLREWQKFRSGCACQF
jgi:hypothetical protein